MALLLSAKQQVPGKSQGALQSNSVGRELGIAPLRQTKTLAHKTEHVLKVGGLGIY